MRGPARECACHKLIRGPWEPWIDPPPGGVTQITCQGTVTGTNIPSTPTDNPGTATPGDPTVISVQPPVLPVPTLNEWGLLVLLTSLLGCALFTLRRQRRRTAL